MPNWSRHGAGGSGGADGRQAGCAGPAAPRGAHPGPDDAAAAPGLAQAALGARLAALRLGDGDVPRRRWQCSAPPHRPTCRPAWRRSGDCSSARAAARNDDSAGAAAILVAVATPAADDLRATVLTDVKDWRGAAAALASLAARTLPPAGPLTPAQQDVVLRLASAQACAGNDAGLQAAGAEATLRAWMARAPTCSVCSRQPRCLIVTDLRRSGREVALAHALPAAVGGNRLAIRLIALRCHR